MNGAGNRFGIFDARRTPDFQPAPTFIQKLAGKGGAMGDAGADQIIVMRAAKSGGDVYMQIWNNDGHEVGACGNASRCIPWLMMEESGKTKIMLETKSGTLIAEREGAQSVSVNMGAPRLKWDQIPLSEYMGTRVIDIKLGPIDNPVLFGPGAVNMGNPHCVFFVHNINDIEPEKVGPMIEYHPLFPEQANVGFAEIRSRSDLRLRVWERGAGLTKACGTGACAALVAAHRQGRTGRNADIEMDGGTLSIKWRSDGDVIKTGPVKLESRGVVPF